ncbi:MAG: YceI family protein [Saprospiraceae bacterium]|nr:YceI family protein [Saprospiraceae bacterium]MBK8484824.1 YceI family protein [Saprospiraceae bacterium]MBK9720876.1 YceI family protein [Saprospiraceae bacterium]MBK9729647.1 YceI family protein [Saprospiraceae bacterium]
MKRIFGFTEIIGILTFFSFLSNKLHTDVYKVDANQSSLEWIGEKITGKHNGTIKFISGEIKNNHGSIHGVFEFDMTSIECQDLEPGPNKTKLETFLKSSNFFDAALFPKSQFIITSVTPLKETNVGTNTHTIKGLLTIKDKTNEISFGAKLTLQGNRFSCLGIATIDRTKFDIKYRSKTFFPDIGDKMIYDEFTLKFNVVANK